jgi:hypothetical protein
VGRAGLEPRAFDMTGNGDQPPSLLVRAPDRFRPERSSWIRNLPVFRLAMTVPAMDGRCTTGAQPGHSDRRPILDYRMIALSFVEHRR